MSVTIVIPVKTKQNLMGFIEGNQALLCTYPVVVMDSGGGEALHPIAAYYVQADVPMWTARQQGYEFASTEYILNLDCDTILPTGFVQKSLALLREKADCVAIDYDTPQGHLAFGASIWKTGLLKKLYDYSVEKTVSPRIVKVAENHYANLQNGWCECFWMWSRLRQNGGKLATLPLTAIHLKEGNSK